MDHMNPFSATFRIRPYGDHALLLSWEERIDYDINLEVQTFFHLLESNTFPGYLYSIPAYCSLTVVFNHRKTNGQAVEQHLLAIHAKEKAKPGTDTWRTLRIPVCYDDAFAPDINALARQKGISVEAVIRLHTSTTYRVFMLGFLPGFPYMGRLPEALYAPRKDTPRLKVPAGSVGLAGLQTGIYPSASPGGWQLIGQTPWRIVSPEKEYPFLFQPGDQVQFFSITPGEFADMQVHR